MITTSALIAMSGGVDSSVAAYIMKKRGYTCEGATMRLYNGENVNSCNLHTCCSKKDIEDAQEIAFALDIPYEVVDYVADFRGKIIDKFVRTYELGGTPNPCIDCNRYMKFDKLLDYAEEKGLSYVVTGHYARVEYDEKLNRYILRKGVDETKDQSYVLYTLTQKQLAHLILPLGNMRKEDVRKIAESNNLVNARKHDSQDICFVPDGDYGRFIEDYTGKKCYGGDIVNYSGEILGQHKGLIKYTIGQRKGLGIAHATPLYVCEKDIENNRLIVGDNEDLYAKSLIADDINLISVEKIDAPLKIKAKVRYGMKEQDAVVEALDMGKVRVVFDTPQRAITTGQALVMYDGDKVLGGGTIIGVER